MTALKLKPGAIRSIDELKQATEEVEMWAKRRDILVLDCYRLGWSVIHIAKAAGMSRHTVYERIRKVQP